MIALPSLSSWFSFRGQPFFVVCFALFFFVGATDGAGEVSVEPAGDGYAVKALSYQALFDAYGALLSLKVAGEEYIAKGPEVPGSYFYRGIVIITEKAEREGNTIVARGGGVELKWAFSDDELSVEVACRRRQPVSFFILFNGAIESLGMGGEDRFSVPHEGSLTGDLSFHRTNGRVDVSGGEKILPFRAQQAFKVELAPAGSRTINIRCSGQSGQ